jgi:hypothetical protein
MSLLQQEQVDDAALGEELTKGSSHLVRASVIAAIVVTIAIGLYMFLSEKPPAGQGEIISVWAHPQHTVSSGLDANGEPMAKEDFEQVMVFTRIRLHNRGMVPLFVNQITVNATLADGIHTAYARTNGQYDQVFLAYPSIPVPHESALPFNATIAPGQTIEGTFVSNFGIGKEQWDARTGLNFIVGFQYQPNLVLTPKVAITEQ